MFDIIRPITKVITDDIDDDLISGILQDVENKENKFGTIEDLKTHLINTIKNYKDYLNDYLIGQKNKENYLKFNNFNDFATSINDFKSIFNFRKKEIKTTYYKKLFGDTSHLEIIGVIVGLNKNILKKYENFIKSVLKDYINTLEDKNTPFIEVDKYYIKDENKLFMNNLFNKYDDNLDKIFKLSTNINEYVKKGKYEHKGEKEKIFSNDEFVLQFLDKYKVKLESRFEPKKDTQLKFSGAIKILLPNNEEKIISNLDGLSPIRDNNKKQILSQIQGNNNYINELIELYKTIKLLESPFTSLDRQIDGYIKETLNGGDVEKKYGVSQFANLLIKQEKETDAQYNKEGEIINLGKDNSIKKKKEIIEQNKFLNIDLKNGYKITITGEKEFGEIETIFNGNNLINKKIEKKKDSRGKEKEKIVEYISDEFKTFVSKDIHNLSGIQTLTDIKVKLLGEDNSYKSLLVNGIYPTLIDNNPEIEKSIKDIITPSYKFELPKPPKKEKKK